MNEIGTIFKEARARTGKTIEEAVRETKIAKKYLIAIENEDFDVFPGETYLIGFMRNYAQFLGIDPDEVVHRYKDLKIQEQPAPIEQLMVRPVNVKRYVLLVVIALMVIASVIFIVKSQGKGKKVLPQEVFSKAEEEKTQPRENIIAFNEEELIRDFLKGDVIEVQQEGVAYRIRIDSIGDNLNFSIGELRFMLSTNERVEIDFDRDGKKDVLMRTNRLGEGKVNLTIKKLYGTGKAGALTEAGSEKTVQEGKISPVKKKEAAGSPEVVLIKEEDMLQKVPVAPKTGFQIVSSYEKTEINSVVKASGTCYFGYIVDEEDKKEALLRKGDELRLSAKDIMRIMVANPGVLELNINEIPLSLGKKGEIVAKVVRWYRDADNKDLYHLVIDDWEK
jgi:transcriptional regulator with XRE-family HTH domain